jgi:protein O-mannosyl-transferase
MSKKKSKQVNTGTAPAKQPAPEQPAAKVHALPKAETNLFQRPRVQALMVAAVALLTWVFYNVCLNNQLTNWDDPSYIRDNPLIKDVSAEGLKNIFSTSVMGNYHPLTILTYAIEYSYVRLQPWLYHFDSLLFHVIVTVLVYWFVNLLTRRPLAAAITALLFGLHPMHVESVAWLAGRKDVVYGMFYIAACVAYVYYVRARERNGLLYFAVALLFICSLLAKPVAVVLPVTLLLIDYFEKRKFSYWVLIEKVPLFAASVGFGIKSVIDQRTFGSLDTSTLTYNYFERIALGGYALCTYLWKAVVPVGLCNFYPYPEKPGGVLPYWYFGYTLAIAVGIFLLWKFARRNRTVVFGALLFLVNIALLLQFIPVGGAIIADRYAYISYLGLFFMAGWYVSGYFEPGANRQTGSALLVVSVVYSMFLGYLTNDRCKVWYDATSLWRDEIEKQPKTYNAYNNLGFEYFNKFNESVDQNMRKIYFDSANLLLNQSIALNPTFANSHISLGELMRSAGNFPEARKHYYKALSLHSFDKDAEAYLGLGIIYAISRNFDSSGYCFRKAVSLKNPFPEAHSNFGNFFDMTHQPDSALAHYAISIAQNPDMFAPHLNRGRLLQRMNRYEEAMKDFEAAMALNPDNGEIYYARSMSYAHRGDKAHALQDIETAKAKGFRQVDNNYYQSMKSR